jgi:hypothetical protein
MLGSAAYAALAVDLFGEAIRSQPLLPNLFIAARI